MNTPSRREHPRVPYESEILYAPGETEAFRESRMYNLSKGGLYFETPELLPEFSNVQIKMKEGASPTEELVPFQSYVAGIRWRQEVQHNGAAVYGFGVRFLERRQETSKSPVIVEEVCCDVCGDRKNRRECRMDTDFVVYCPLCHNHVDRLPKGKIKDCIHRFLSGNVV